MKTVLFSALACLTLSNAQAQHSGLPKLRPGEYFNNFQRFTNESPNVNAAFSNLQLLASGPESQQLTTELIHNSFAQVLVVRINEVEEDRESRAKRKPLAMLILTKMSSDTSAFLRQQSQPLVTLTKVQDASENPEQLAALTKQFIANELDGKDIYQFRAGRYGLLIFNIINKHPALKPVSDELLNKLAIRFQTEQVAVTDSSGRAELDKRAWYRYLNAYTSFIKSQQTNDPTEKGNLLKKAFEYSPDLVDKNHQTGYFYDMHLLLNEDKEGFQQDYLEFITGNSDKKQLLDTLLKMALVEPAYKEKLRTAYQEVMPGNSFDAYWKKGIDASAVNAPAIRLTNLDKKLFSTKSLSGQWVLVDFWGTWCGPCREEHPALQQFYDSTVIGKNKNLSLLTVACRDTEPKVKKYMQNRKFNFPVAMSDNKIEKSFKVQGYPTKVLITPAGKYVTVPFGVDWVSFVNKYVEAD